MKKVIAIILILIGFSSFGQNPGSDSTSMLTQNASWKFKAKQWFKANVYFSNLPKYSGQNRILVYDSSSGKLGYKYAASSSFDSTKSWSTHGNVGANGFKLGTTNKRGFGVVTNNRQRAYYDSIGGINYDTILFYLEGSKFLHTSGGGGSGTGSVYDNLFIGYRAGQVYSGTAYANVGVGRGAMENLNGNFPDANSNVAIGYNAMNKNVKGSRNVIVGVAAMGESTRGAGLTAVGSHAANYNNGQNSTYVGRSAGENTYGSDESVGLGYYASFSDTVDGNVSVGAYSNYLNISSTKRTSVGFSTLAYNTGEQNTAVGYNAIGGVGAGAYNTAVGSNCLQSITSGITNTAIGREAGKGVTTGNNNVLIGKNVGETLTTGSSNVLIGTDIITPPSGGTASNQMNIAHAIYGYGTMSDSTSAYLGFGGNPVNSAKLAIKSTTQGFLPPVMTATQGSAISSPAEGLMIYVTNTNGTFTSKGWWGWNGSAWEKLNN